MNKYSKTRLLSVALLAWVMISSCSQTAKTDEANTPATKTEQPKEKLISTDVVANTTEITFDRDTYDFGEIKAGDIVNYEFKFTNTGDHDLIVTSAKGTCGCTVPDWPKHPIKPGDSDVIKVQFNSKNKKGAQNKTVTVVANTKPSESQIFIKGVVTAAE